MLNKALSDMKNQTKWCIVHKYHLPLKLWCILNTELFFSIFLNSIVFHRKLFTFNHQFTTSQITQNKDGGHRKIIHAAVRTVVRQRGVMKYKINR
jgi:hypothetical protein